jgi:hypothetical protein
VIALRSSAALVTACLAVAGCGGDDAERPAATATAAAAATAAAVLTRADVAADCRAHVPHDAAGAPPSLLNPPARVAVRPGGASEGQITRVSGFVGMTPGAFLEAWRGRPDVTVVDGEDEGFEAEVHIQAAGSQVFWQVKKVCDSGSRFTAIVTVAAAG